MATLDLHWPEPRITRVPYALYTRPDVFEVERERLFMGPTWNFLCMEAELPQPCDYRASWVGDVPVLVTRDDNGELHGFENRCAHRGALICMGAGGNGTRIACVYHGWTYDLKGNLASVTFRHGVNRQGGMPVDFKLEEHRRKPLTVENFAGLLFGSFASAPPPLADYLGEEIASRIRRVMRGPARVLGYNSQVLNNNWKLYIENVKDPYHASLLHLFFNTFRLNRLSAQGGIIIDSSGGNHVSYSKAASDRASTDYDSTALRAKREDYRLADPSLIASRDEFGDGITLQILSVFPNFVLQQIQNCLCTRQVVPRAHNQTELLWTYFGFADDDDELSQMRLKQSNLVGPGGYVSMEDGAVGNFVQRALAGAGDDSELLEMGGREILSQATRATESPIRGFWKVYRERMGL